MNGCLLWFGTDLTLIVGIDSDGFVFFMEFYQLFSDDCGSFFLYFCEEIHGNFEICGSSLHYVITSGFGNVCSGSL